MMMRWMPLPAVCHPEPVRFAAALSDSKDSKRFGWQGHPASLKPCLILMYEEKQC